MKAGRLLQLQSSFLVFDTVWFYIASTEVNQMPLLKKLKGLMLMVLPACLHAMVVPSKYLHGLQIHFCQLCLAFVYECALSNQSKAEETNV